jgi:hypothetical protein
MAISPVYAATPPPLQLTGFIKALYNIVFPASVMLGMFLILKSGYTLMTSQGDPQKTVEGKENLTSAIMGMIFVLASVGILRIIIGTFITGGNPGF